ncbi:hypothetical protein PF008_g3527 [Phytophthora fragariae]|uniref:Secreted protein n=1 Tax=Phytophthora fragariae TaxID=53985 RepID=A0A6G0SDZ1_9STRA|nr:hypothetical protein PF008_g3527 [Phytophthora fragariae]
MRFWWRCVLRVGCVELTFVHRCCGLVCSTRRRVGVSKMFLNCIECYQFPPLYMFGANPRASSSVGCGANYLF